MAKAEVTANNGVSEADLIGTLRNIANDNQRVITMRVSFLDGDYSGGNDSEMVFDIVSVEFPADVIPENKTDNEGMLKGYVG